jgi:hypothetical protein
MSTTDRFYWGQAGTTYYAVDSGQIIALLYWEAAGLSPVAGPDGEPVFTEAGWFWLATDNPERHFAVDAPDPSGDLGEEQLAAVIDLALEAAAKEIISYLDGHGRL